MNTQNQETFIVLLRAVNVSGKNIIRMEELRKVLTDSGFGNVKTYIQSGNIVLSNEHNQEQEVAEKVEEIINRFFNLRVSAIAILRSRFEKMVAANPLVKQTGDGEKRLFFTFLKTPEVSEELKKLDSKTIPRSWLKPEKVLFIHLYRKTMLNLNYRISFLKRKPGRQPLPGICQLV